MKSAGTLLLGGVDKWFAEGVEGDLRFLSSGITNGVIDRAYGKYGAEQNSGMPTCSLPLSITAAPKETRCFAFSIVDFDAVQAVGFCWVHWLVCNFTDFDLPENASLEQKNSLVQGVNSWNAPLLGEAALPRSMTSGYGGMSPPDRPHCYDLTLYACSEPLDLKNGYYWNEFLNALHGKVLAASTLRAIYCN